MQRSWDRTKPDFQWACSSRSSVTTQVIRTPQESNVPPQSDMALVLPVLFYSCFLWSNTSGGKKEPQGLWVLRKIIPDGGRRQIMVCRFPEILRSWQAFVLHSLSIYCEIISPQETMSIRTQKRGHVPSGRLQSEVAHIELPGMQG